MKILFLDIDGVLNSKAGWERDNPDTIKYMQKECVTLLNKIVAEIPDLKIVISSSWRHAFPMEDIITMLGDAGKVVIGKTPQVHLSGGQRGDEIQSWLDFNPGVENFVILDDDSDMKHLGWRLRKTSSDVGLTEEIANQVIADFKDKECGCAVFSARCDCYDGPPEGCCCHHKEFISNYGRVVFEKAEWERRAKDIHLELSNRIMEIMELRRERPCICCGNKSNDETRGTSYCADCDGGICTTSGHCN